MRTVRYRPTIERILLATLLAVAVAVAVGACALFDPEADGTFTVILPGHELVDPLAVVVIDRTGTVMAVVVGQGNFQGDRGRASRLGGMCDVRTTLTVETTIDTVQITEATKRDPEVCRAAGVTRSIAIRFDPPLAPEFAEFVRDG
jgi:hypothetical protein